MNKKAVIFIIFIFVVFALYAIQETNVIKSSFLFNILQEFTSFLMLLSVILAGNQLYEIRKAEEKKDSMAVTSLIEEIKYNQKLIKECIQHSEVGANVTLKEGKISWEWNKPRLEAFERYGILACRNSPDIFKELSTLYENLESCKVIIEEIHQLVAVNLVAIRREGGNVYFQSEIGRLNKQLYEICKEVENSMHNLIIRLGLIIKRKLSKGF